MILTISGLHGTGKSTIGKRIAELFKLQYYATGEVFRKLATKHKMTLSEFTEYAENNPEIDKKLDEKINKIAKKDKVIIDSQLSAYILKDKADIKIFLQCDLETRVKRMCERDGCSYKTKVDETLRREFSEANRFKQLYNYDLENENTKKQLYDVIIDTKNLTIDEVVNQLASEIKNKLKI